MYSHSSSRPYILGSKRLSRPRPAWMTLDILTRLPAIGIPEARTPDPSPWAARSSSFLNPRVSGVASPDLPPTSTLPPDPNPSLRRGRATLWAAGLRPRRPRVLLTRPRLGLSVLRPSTATLAPPCLRRRVEQHEPGACTYSGR